MVGCLGKEFLSDFLIQKVSMNEVVTMDDATVKPEQEIPITYELVTDGADVTGEETVTK